MISSAAVDAEMPNNDGPGTQDVFTVPRPEYDHITPPADAASNKDNDPGLPEHIVRGIKRQAHLGGKHDIDGKGALHPIKKPRLDADHVGFPPLGPSDAEF